MLTVPEAARRTGKNPETIRRWIREGRLRAARVGTQHVIDEGDLQAALGGDDELPVPDAWARMPDGRPAPNVVRAVRRARSGR
ncbi:MAG TPA: helix-turn-helix domain-containing protein [Vitreimonas sp.]|nr:helix-turn-helix domain-containing protein [Vitreimonas sp.]